MSLAVSSLSSSTYRSIASFKLLLLNQIIYTAFLLHRARQIQLLLHVYVVIRSFEYIHVFHIYGTEGHLIHICMMSERET